MRGRFSVCIPVKNEEANLALCLESVKDFDDVVIVDSGSTDRTREIAAQYGRTVVDFHWNGRFPKKRNWVLRTYTFRHEWVLFLDADERVTPAFKEEAEKVLSGTVHHGFWVGYRNWFLGRMLRHGDPMRKLSLLRIGQGEYEEIHEDRWSPLDMEIHEQLVVSGSVGAISAKLEHHDVRSLSAYNRRHNDYSTWEANRYLSIKDRTVLTARQRLKYRIMMWPIFPPGYFVASYLLKGGFLDGRAGFFFAVGKMFYFFQIQMKIVELRLKAAPPDGLPRETE